MNELIAAFAALSLLLQNAIHGSGGAEILSFVQQGGLDGGGGAVLEALMMEDVQHMGAFISTESTGRDRPLPWRIGRGHWCRKRTQPGSLPVEGSTGNAEDQTGGNDSNQGGE